MTPLEIHNYLSANCPAAEPSFVNRRPLVHGIGLNDAPYQTTATVAGGARIRDPAYSCWTGMLRSAIEYGEPVCEQWKKFSNFLPWWETHFRDGWRCTNTLVSESNEWSPSNVVFAPMRILTVVCKNQRVSDRSKVRGVHIDNNSRKKNVFRVNVVKACGQKELRSFASEEEALDFWKAVIKSKLLGLKQETDKIDVRIYPTLLRRVEDI